MSTIQNLQDHIGQLQQALRERNETIASQNRDLSAAKARHVEDATTITKLRVELADALKALT